MMLNELEFECREMVKRGMRMLTTDQRDRVDLARLDVQSDGDCVLGQLYGDFGTGVSALFGDAENEELREAARCGFFVAAATPNYWSRYPMLTCIWADMLRKEREIRELNALLEPIGSF